MGKHLPAEGRHDMGTDLLARKLKPAPLPLTRVYQEGVSPYSYSMVTLCPSLKVTLVAALAQQCFRALDSLEHPTR